MLFLWKFIVSGDKWTQDPEDPALQYKGCVALAVSATEEGARAALTLYANANGYDARWLRAARVVQIQLVSGAVGAWAQV